MEFLFKIMRMLHAVVGITPAEPEHERAYLLLWLGALAADSCWWWWSLWWCLRRISCARGPAVAAWKPASFSPGKYPEHPFSSNSHLIDRAKEKLPMNTLITILALGMTLGSGHLLQTRDHAAFQQTGGGFPAAGFSDAFGAATSPIAHRNTEPGSANHKWTCGGACNRYNCGDCMVDQRKCRYCSALRYRCYPSGPERWHALGRIHAQSLHQESEAKHYLLFQSRVRSRPGDRHAG